MSTDLSPHWQLGVSRDQTYGNNVMKEPELWNRAEPTHRSRACLETEKASSGILLVAALVGA